jgi:hypothetical protein
MVEPMKVKRQPRPRTLVILALALLGVSVALLLNGFSREPVQEFLVAKQDLASGAVLDVDQFTRVKIDLGPTKAAYLSSLPHGQALRTALRKGELLAASAIGSANELPSVVLTPSQPLSAAVAVGSLVDVWFVAKADAGQTISAPIRVAAGLEVRAVTKASESAGYSLSGTTVELATGEADLPALVLASADGGFISVIAKQ